MASVAPIHRFVEKLRQRSVLPGVQAAVGVRRDAPARSLSALFAPPASGAPLSINLDLTVACNYACPHCIDENLLNTRFRFSFDEVADALATLRVAGLRSVILIGGGEPTVHPDFVAVVERIKLLGLACGIVSNGSRTGLLEAAAPPLERGDWIRLSLDAATDEIFQRLHRPRKAVALEAICRGASAVKRRNPALTLGFSFVVIPPEATAADPRLVANHTEMAAAARLARDAGFDYISFKPYLMRDAEGREVLPSEGESVAAIRDQLAAAEAMATDDFRVIPSINLQALFDESAAAAARRQPRRCRMQALRQVLTPHGLYGCPAYRGDERSRIAGRDAYRDAAAMLDTAAATRHQVEAFDASHECRHITCLYSAANWGLDDLVDGRPPARRDPPVPDQQAVFL